MAEAVALPGTAGVEKFFEQTPDMLASIPSQIVDGLKDRFTGIQNAVQDTVTQLKQSRDDAKDRAFEAIKQRKIDLARMARNTADKVKAAPGKMFGSLKKGAMDGIMDFFKSINKGIKALKLGWAAIILAGALLFDFINQGWDDLKKWAIESWTKFKGFFGFDGEEWTKPEWMTSQYWSDLWDSWTIGIPSWEEIRPEWTKSTWWSTKWDSWTISIPSWEEIRPEWTKLTWWSDKFNWNLDIPSWEEISANLPQWIRDAGVWFKDKFNWTLNIPSWEEIRPEWTKSTWWSDKFNWNLDIPSWEEISANLPQWIRDAGVWFKDKFNWNLDIPSWEEIKLGFGEFLSDPKKYINDVLSNWNLKLPTWEEIKLGFGEFLSDPKKYVSDVLSNWDLKLPTWEEIKLGFSEFWKDPLTYIKDKFTSWNISFPSWEEVKAFFPTWVHDGAEWFRQKLQDWAISIPSGEEMKKLLPQWLVDAGTWISEKFASWGIDIPSWDTVKEGLVEWLDDPVGWFQRKFAMWKLELPSWEEITAGFAGFWSDPKKFIQDKFTSWNFTLPDWATIKAGLGPIWNDPVKYISDKVNGWFTWENDEGVRINIFDKIDQLFNEYVYNPIMNLFDTIGNAIDGLKISVMKWVEEKGTFFGKKTIDFSEEITEAEASISARNAAANKRNNIVPDAQSTFPRDTASEEMVIKPISKPTPIPAPLPVNAAGAYVDVYKQMQSIGGQQAADSYINSISPGLDPKLLKEVLEAIKNQSGGISNQSIDKSNKTTIINDPTQFIDPTMNM